MIGAVAGIAAGVNQLYKMRQERRQLVAGTDQTVVTTAVDMAERLTSTASSLIGPLQTQLADARKEASTMRERIARLEAQFLTATTEYEDCRRRERDAYLRATRLEGELEKIQAYLLTRRLDDAPGSPAPPRRRVWTDEEREEFRRRKEEGGVDMAADPDSLDDRKGHGDREEEL